MYMHTQMVSLHQDPEGLTVFRAETTGVATGVAVHATSDHTTIESLRRRIKELETIVSENVSSSLYIVLYIEGRAIYRIAGNFRGETFSWISKICVEKDSWLLKVQTASLN